jgi:hypothetical protein
MVVGSAVRAGRGDGRARGMVAGAGVVARGELDARQIRDRMDRAPTPRERWLLAQGWSANKVAAPLARAAHSSGAWLAAFAQAGPAALACEQPGRPPTRDREAQAGLQGAVQAAPGEGGSALANGNWPVVRQGLEARRGVRRRAPPSWPRLVPCWPRRGRRGRRAEVTANTCLGTKAAVQARMWPCFAGLPARVADVHSRCRRTPSPRPWPSRRPSPILDPIGASV